MSEYVYVTMSHDYADEFDVDCCYVTTKKQHLEEMMEIQNAFDAGVITDSNEFYFGTNEYLMFSDWEEFDRGVTAVDCSKPFFDEFFELNAGSAVGFCVVDKLLERARGGEVE